MASSPLHADTPQIASGVCAFGRSCFPIWRSASADMVSSQATQSSRSFWRRMLSSTPRASRCGSTAGRLARTMLPEAPFRAFRVHEENGQITSRFESISLDELGPGDVVVRISYSTINYKDALAATGAGKILRKYPLVAGIDFAGEVISTSDARYRVGDKVLVTGCELIETHDGGYAEYARVSGDWIVPIPAPLDEFKAMGLGTAGFTAALAIHRME